MSEATSDAARILTRLDRIPVWPYPRKVLWIVGFGFFFAFFDIVTIGFAIPVVVQQFNITSELASWAISGSLIGYIIGSFLDSRIADRYGRRVSLLLSVSFFTIGSLMSATSPNIWWLIGWRVISGMGIGAEISAVSTYLGELSPAARRGRNTAWAIVAGYAGLAIVPFVALGLVPNFDWGWRALMVIGALGGLLIGVMRSGLPYSVHWLLSRGRIAEAEAIVDEAEQRARDILGHDLPPPDPADDTTIFGRTAFYDLLKPPYLQRLVLIATIWFFYYIGNYAWLTLAPTLFVKEGYTLTHSIFFMMLTGLGFVFGSLMAVMFSDRAERKTTIALICVAWAAALFVIGWQTSNTVILAFGFIASTTIGLLIPILYTYTAENFPTSVRATGVSATDGLGHIGGALAPAVTLTAYHYWGLEGAFGVLAATGLITGVLIMLGIRTTGRPLTRTAHVSRKDKEKSHSPV
ncbi:MFS transporter [Hoeflea sp.]|uniref:MFS transporter n=1 Tax=Hoeflea sp. TaxID=1940281 RepID=UPI003B0203CF